jgi:enediyne biosynthesis protein E4
MRAFEFGITTAIVVLGTLNLHVNASPPLFTNQTAASGITTSHQTTSFPQSQYSAGAAVGDFNNDGWQDLFVLKGGANNLPDRLFINNGNGTFTDQAASWGVAVAHKGKGCSVGDFNNDGWLDLYVTSCGPNGQPNSVGQYKLYKNNGNNTFTNIAVAAGVATTHPSFCDAWSSTFGDYDLDGDLDLFVGGFSTLSPSNLGNRLFRNNGNETFTDVTASIGLFNGLGPIACLSNSLVDMNGDFYPELLMGGDFKNAGFIGSRYFKNNGNGTFTDVTQSSNTGHEENGMGQAVGDWNNDLKLDWYVTSIYNGGSWTGNKLYRASGQHIFVQFAAAADVDDGGYGWGALGVDFNHDGLLDILETNGDSASSGSYFNEQSYLWINNGNNTFTEMALGSGLAHFGKGRALLRFDYDNDGDQDVVITANSEPIYLFRNDVFGGDTNWLRVFLDTQRTNLAPNGLGSKVYVTAGGVTQMRSVDGHNGFVGVSELSAHFGVGANPSIEEVKVVWNDGTQKILHNVDVNQTITISALPDPCIGDIVASGAVDVDDLLSVINAWGACIDPERCPADIAPPSLHNGTVDVDDLLAVINAWGTCP